MAFKQLVSKLFFNKSGTDVAVSDTEALPTRDDMNNAEFLEDQTAGIASEVLTFNFTQPVHMAFVYFSGVLDTEESRATSNTQIPSSSLGIVVPHEVPTVIPMTTDIVEVFTPAGGRVTVYGFYR
ncbi:MAG: hypothetical protein R3230_00100 [Nitrosopumilaceae archaeon]|nr:hypothetical protein [Nitrosopumilaceae archaeon]